MDIHFPHYLVPGYVLYAIAICLLLKPGTPISQRNASLLVLSLLAVSGISGLIDWVGISVLAVITLCVSQVLSSKQALRYLGWTSLFLSSLALALHVIPGFVSETIFGPSTLGKSTLPYTLNANLDKGLGAILIIFCFRYWLKTPFSLSFSPKIFLRIFAAIIGLFTFGYLIGVEPDLKFGELTLAFIFLNLFVTCVAEESFFRLLIQRFFFLKTNNALLAIFASTIIFTLAHFHTGPGAMERLALIFFAGLIYAWVYQRTNSILLAILTHFAVNIIHLSFFVYPATFD